MTQQSSAKDQIPNNQVFNEQQFVKVWEFPIRMFHWLLVASFVVAWATGDEIAWLHELSGYTVAGLLAFRLLWGFLGNEYARFGNFIYHPRKILAFLRDTVHLRAKRYIGHNPAGGAMVILLLLTLSAIVVSGHMLTMDYWWGSEAVEDVHETSVNVALFLVAMHIVGVVTASLEHHENLVKAMFNGIKKIN